MECLAYKALKWPATIWSGCLILHYCPFTLPLAEKPKGNKQLSEAS
jgi:hypothetical protein